MIHVWIPGKPQPQGSKKGFIINGKVVLVESAKGLKPWRNKIADGYKRAENYKKFEGAVHLSLAFYFKKPTSNKTKMHVQKPDVDKTIRSVLDALTGVAYSDDSQVVSISAWKYWSENNVEGVNITAWEVDENWEAKNA